MMLGGVGNGDVGRISVIVSLWRSKSAAISMVFIVVLAVIGLLAPVIAPKDPTEIEIFREVNGETINPPFPPSGQNWFGTDQFVSQVDGFSCADGRCGFVNDHVACSQ